MLKVFKKRWSTSVPKERVDVSEAVERSIEYSTDDRGGELERLGEQVRNLTRTVGRLVDALVERNGLTEDQLDAMLNFEFQVEAAS